MKKHQLFLASLAFLGAGFLATSSNVQAAEQNNTGFARQNDKVYYYENGKKLSGWQLINVNTDDKKTGVQKLWIYLNQSGEVQTGWVNDNGTWYYLNELTGESKGIAFMKKGFFEVNKTWYYFDESGAMQTGWKQLDGNWYYFQADGSLLKNATTPDGYKVNEEGIWKQAVAAVNSEAVKPEQKQEANSSIVEQPKQDSNLEANASEKKEKE